MGNYTFFIDLDDRTDRFEITDSLSRSVFQIAKDRSLPRRISPPVRARRRGDLIHVDLATTELPRDAFPVLLVDVAPGIRLPDSTRFQVRPWRHLQEDVERIRHVGTLHIGYAKGEEIPELDEVLERPRQLLIVAGR